MLSRIPAIIAVLIIGYLPALVFTISYRGKPGWLWLKIVLWAVPTLFFAFYAWVLIAYGNLFDESITRITHWVNLIFFAIFAPATLFLLFVGIRALLFKIFHKQYQWPLYVGAFCSFLFLASFINASSGRYDYQVRYVTIAHPDLPVAFDGFKIAQISDVHLGNLTSAHSFMKQIKDQINEEQVDALFLTGDMLNTIGFEGEEYHPYLIEMRAKEGKYAIMGNHDYGTYARFETEEDYDKNLDLAHNTYRSLGFDLLLDEHRILNRAQSSIGIIGVENWSLPPFHSYGSLSEAMDSMPKLPFNILLTHDPNHWRAEALEHPELSLTLSGHTHSAQIALNILGWQWSPAHYFFPEWDGLYQSDNQLLFVNRGLGYVGVPYRLGSPPELTIITLTHDNQLITSVESKQHRLWSGNSTITAISAKVKAWKHDYNLAMGLKTQLR